MNNQLTNLLKDGIIHKEVLLMKHFKIIGINERQAFLLLRLINLEEYGKVTINSISKQLNLSKNESETFIAELLKSKLVRVKHTKDGMNFNFEKLWQKLLEIYYPPIISDSNEVKINWFLNQINMNPTPIITEQLTEWVSDSTNWNRLIEIVEFLSKNKIQKVEWKVIKQLFQSDFKKESELLKDLKKIAMNNWLVD